jgi:subtilisin family serine protease
VISKGRVWFGLGLTLAVLLLLVARRQPPVPRPGSAARPPTTPLITPRRASAPATPRRPAAPAMPVTPLSPPTYAGADVLAQEETPPDAEGISHRTRLLRTGGKYPYIREETTRRTDATSGETVTVWRVAMVADHIMLRLHPDASSAELETLNARYGGTIRRRLKRPGHYLVAFDVFDLHTVPARVADYRAAPAIADVAEPDYLVAPADTVPDDPRYDDLWGIKKVNCPAAWDIETGNGAIVVGMIDSGVNYNHEDLAGNIWTNPNETPTNGIDDDANGYIDDVHGWDFGDDDNNPIDINSGHGTHTAGTVAAIGNNSTGVVGVSWSSRLMVLKMFGDSGSGATSDAIDALEYARVMRTNGVPVRLTSNSWGGGGYSLLLKETIEATGEAGMLFVAAAGNFGWNNDTQPFYPATYDSSNILSVAATVSSDALAYFSHFGVRTVDIGAPGTSILSTYKGTNNSTYYSDSGTSMACPHVAGACALLWEAYPEATWEQVRSYIMAGVATNAVLAGKIVSGGRLDVAGALHSIPPAIAHTPLVNTTNTEDDHRFDATVTPVNLLTPDSPRLLWNTNGSTTVHTTNVMVRLTNDLYEATLPVQPLGTRVHYYIEATTIGGVSMTTPSVAPLEQHAFEVVQSEMLWVSGAPSDLGTATPAYGMHDIPSGIAVQASADRLANITPQHRYECSGWHAIGSAPSIGHTNAVTFVLDDMTALEWQWQSQYSLAQSSSPTGLVADVSWWEAGATGLTVTAMDPVMVNTTAQRFVEWQMDGLRWPDGTNTALNPATHIGMATARQAVAIYIPASEDSDSDTLPDWWERRYFGSLTPTIADDRDGDGFRNDEELADGTDPRDSASYPAPPLITLTPLADPQDRPAPWSVSAVVTDNFSVADVALHWRQVPYGWNQTPMTAEGDDLYRADIPAPGSFGQTYEYRITAIDPAGYSDQTPTYRFDVVYPIFSFSPTTIAEVLPPDSVTHIDVGLTNGGNTSLTWTAQAGWFDPVEQGLNGITHSGVNDAWHRTTRRAFSGTHAWYSGKSATHQYGNLVNASLILPPFTPAAGAELTFKHWAKIEYDDERQDDHYWDGGIVELSTDDGVSFTQITPIGGYPHRITPNLDSPFADHTPCYGGDGSGWQRAAFDLSAYAGQTVRVRFRFGSDRYVVDEGWYIDDLLVIPAAASPDWLSVLPPAGTLAPGESSVVTARLDSAGIPTGDFPGVVRLTATDPLHPTNDIPVQMWVRSPPQLALLAAHQTSTDGSGRVAITNELWDADGESCSLEIDVMTATGAWVHAWIGDSASQLSGVTVSSNAPLQVGDIATALAGLNATNRVTTGWLTLDGPTPINGVTTAVVRVRAWDGRAWSPAVTSTPFMVDNEAPTSPEALAFTSYTNDTWATNRAFALHWSGSHDRAGVGLAGYALGHGLHPTTHSNSVVDTVLTNGIETVGSDGTNWWFDLRAVDAFGNASPPITIGPARVDTQPPSPTHAVITPSMNPFGDYVVGHSVTSQWSGLSDNLSGITGYYYAWTNAGGSTGGTFSVSADGVLSNALPDATNTIHVWARDAAGWIGAAATQPVLVLAGTNDFDADGFTTDEELLTGHDASDPASRFGLDAVHTAASPSGTVVVLEWRGLSNRTYHLYGSTTLMEQSGNWLPLVTASNLPGVDGGMSHTDRVEQAGQRFYRLGVE